MSRPNLHHKLHYAQVNRANSPVFLRFLCDLVGHILPLLFLVALIIGVMGLFRDLERGLAGLVVAASALFFVLSVLLLYG